MRNVRQMVTRVSRHGYIAEIRRAARHRPRRDRRGLVRRRGSWRGSPTERGFSMALGRVGGPGDGRCVVATATEDGVLRGAAALRAVGHRRAVAGPDAPGPDRPARRERLPDRARRIKAAHALGVKRVSLNFAVFRSALERGERIGAGPVLRAWRGILLFVSRWFQIESLYKFNAKFCPVWVPRFIVFPGTSGRAPGRLAALEAEAFLVWPRLEVRRLARKLGLAAWLRPAAAPAAPAARLSRGLSPRACAGRSACMSRWRAGDPCARVAAVTAARAVRPPAAPPGPPGLPDPGRCLVMGVVNVTPDSFSDGGAGSAPDAAIAHGLELAAQGADIVDVGGESTRPGAQRVTDARRNCAGSARWSPRSPRAGVPVSMDTMRAEVAEPALEAGARLVNDVSGGLADPEMPRLVAEAGVPYVVMHWRGHSTDMEDRAVVRRRGRGRCATNCAAGSRRCAPAGVDPAHDRARPGLGFAKLAEHNWALLAHLRRSPASAAAGAGLPGAGRRVPQAVPRPAAGRAGRDRRARSPSATTRRSR